MARHGGFGPLAAYGRPFLGRARAFDFVPDYDSTFASTREQLGKARQDSRVRACNLIS